MDTRINVKNATVNKCLISPRLYNHVALYMYNYVYGLSTSKKLFGNFVGRHSYLSYGSRFMLSFMTICQL